MKIYLTSNIPLLTLREKYSNDPPAEFLIEDLIDLLKENETNVLNDLSIAISQLKSSKIKFIYELDVKEFIY